MRFECTEQCELPFMLNLPDGQYQVAVDGEVVELEVLQEQFAAHLDDGRFAVVPKRLQVTLDSSYGQPLRTVVRRITTLEVSEDKLPPIGEDELVEDMLSDVIRESPALQPEIPDELRKEAKRRIESMTVDELKNYRLRSAQLRIARKLSAPDVFLAALNAMIRLYMQRFGDLFVEEVTLHQLAAQAPLRGIQSYIQCDEVYVDSYSHVGKIPPMMRRPWLNHPQTLVDHFRADLAKGASPDSVSLLEVRAKGFLERGATRSAIIEASAALDLSVTRKLREGFAKQGKTTTEISDILKSEINFKLRANKLMNQATGKRLADIDGSLYQLVLGHRETYRHGIAHADVEPLQKDTQETIRDFAQLRELVDKISV